MVPGIPCHHPGCVAVAGGVAYRFRNADAVPLVGKSTLMRR